MMHSHAIVMVNVENANSLIEMFMYALGGMALMLSGGFIMLKTQ